MAKHSALGSRLQSLFYLNGYIEVSEETTLTNAVLGKTIYCTGNADYEVILPAANAGNKGTLISLAINTTDYAIVECNGLFLGKEDCVSFFSTGSNWTLASISLFPANFSAPLDGDQTIPSGGSETQLELASATPIGFVQTGNTLVVKYQGRYVINAAIQFDPTGVATTSEGVYIRRASMIKAASFVVPIASFATTLKVQFVDYFYPGDVIDFAATQDSGSPLDVISDPTIVNFNGYRIGYL